MTDSTVEFKRGKLASLTGGYQGILGFSAFFLTVSFFSLPFSLGLHNTSFALAVILAWLGVLLSKSSRPAQWLWHDGLARWLFALLPILLLGSFYSLSSWDASLGASFKKYVKFPLAIAILGILQQSRLRQQAWWAFFAGAALVLLLTYLNFFFDASWLPSRESDWGDQTVVGNYITQGIMLAFWVLMCLHQATGAAKPWQRVLFVGLALLGVLSVAYLLNGRTGYVALLAGLLGYALWACPKKYLAAGLVLMVVVLGLVFATSDRVQERYTLAKQETQLLFAEAQQGRTPTFSSIGARWYMWMKTTELIQERPIIGWGLGSHGIKWCEKAPEPEWCYVGRFTPHNQFLFFTSELGVAGLTWFLGLFFFIAYQGYLNKNLRPVIMGFLGIFLVDSLVNASLWNAREYNFFLLMICLLYARARWDKNDGVVNERP